MKTHGYEAGYHVGVSQSDPEMIKIQFFEQPGIQITAGMEKEVEKHFNRRELRRVPSGTLAASRIPRGYGRAMHRTSSIPEPGGAVPTGGRLAVGRRVRDNPRRGVPEPRGVVPTRGCPAVCRDVP